MARLAAKEGDGLGRADHRTVGEPGIAGEPAGHVDGHDGPPAFIHRRDGGGRLGVERPAEPGAEQRVDDDVVLLRQDRREGSDRAGPAGSRLRRIVRQSLPVARERQRDAIAALAQQPRRDEAVPAIIAWAAQHQHGLPRPGPPADRIGHGATRALHQPLAGQARRDRQAIRLGHLGDGQQGKVEAGCGGHARIIRQRRQRGKSRDAKLMRPSQ